jgi:DNA polymerase-3 subunit epsilon
MDPDPGSVMTNLLTFSGSGPIVVFNAALNRTLLERAFDTHLGITPDWTWLDLHWLLPALFDERRNSRTRLADWMDLFGIETFQRHHALGDAYAIAQLMLAAEARALKRGFISVRHLVDLERTRRQLSTR